MVGLTPLVLSFDLTIYLGYTKSKICQPLGSRLDMTHRDRPFWLSTALFLGMLSLITLLVALRASTRMLNARYLKPSPGSMVSVPATIQVIFDRPITRHSVVGAVTITPTTDFDLRWVGNELHILPQTALLENQTYTITIGPGIRDRAGLELDGQVVWSFYTTPAGR
jgi:hypothetical protein